MIYSENCDHNNEVFQRQTLVGKSLREINSTVFWQNLLPIVNFEWPQILCNFSHWEVESVESGSALWLWPIEYGEATLWDFLLGPQRSLDASTLVPLKAAAMWEPPSPRSYYRGQCGGNQRCPAKTAVNCQTCETIHDHSAPADLPIDTCQPIQPRRAEARHPHWEPCPKYQP